MGHIKSGDLLLQSSAIAVSSREAQVIEESARQCEARLERLQFGRSGETVCTTNQHNITFEPLFLDENNIEQTM